MDAYGWSCEVKITEKEQFIKVFLVKILIFAEVIFLLFLKEVSLNSRRIVANSCLDFFNKGIS
jgi:hypothetical protein